MMWKLIFLGCGMQFAAALAFFAAWHLSTRDDSVYIGDLVEKAAQNGDTVYLPPGKYRLTK